MKDNKILTLILWGVIAVVVIAAGILLNLKDVKNSPDKNVPAVVYDGSENNPVIEGVQ